MADSTPAPPPTPAPRAATSADLPALERLLGDAGLPTAGVAAIVAARPADVLVADDPHRAGELAAAGALEACGDDALLRSVAVHAAWRAHGLGHAMVAALLRLAEARRLRALYLLTTTAEAWFPRFGFVRTTRDAVPPAVAATVEFREACPASAATMVRVLREGPPPG